MILFPFLSSAQIDLVQTTSNDVVINAGFAACGSTSGTASNSFARLYNLTALGYSSFTITKISFGVERFQSGSAVNFPVRVEVYSSSGSIASSDLIYQRGDTIHISNDMVGKVVEVPLKVPAVVSSSHMVIAVTAPHGIPTSSSFFLGGNSYGQTTTASLKASACGVAEFTNYSVLVSPYQHMVIFPSGTPTFILPITLNKLKGEKIGDINKISWTTASEINNTGFEVQRSLGGSNFSRIGFVQSKAVNGSSSSYLNYIFMTVYHRIRITITGLNRWILMAGLPIRTL